MAGGARQRRKERRVDLRDDSKAIAGLKQRLIEARRRETATSRQINAALKRMGVWRVQEFPPHDPDSRSWDRAGFARALAEELKK